jgi:hypothetical protein
MSTLFSPHALRSLKLPNRIVVSPMCQYVAKNGQANSWHLIHLPGALAFFERVTQLFTKVCDDVLFLRMYAQSMGSGCSASRPMLFGSPRSTTANPRPQQLARLSSRATMTRNCTGRL